MASAQVVRYIKCNFMCDDTDESEAVKFCCECTQYLCETCAKQHTKIKKLKHHNFVTATFAYLSGLEKTITTCTLHDGQELKYHCEKDGQAMCNECKEQHVGHDFVEIQDKCKDLLEIVGKKLSGVSLSADEIRKTKVEFTKRFDILSNVIKERNDFLKMALDEIESRMQEELKKHKEKVVQSFDEKIEKIEEKEKIKKSFKEDVSVRNEVSLYQYLVGLDTKFGTLLDLSGQPEIPTLVDTCTDIRTDGNTSLAALQMYLNDPSKTDSDEGCEHYKRKCRLLTPCCNKVYTCHHCHDNNENHALQRSDVTMVMCISCTTVQKITPFEFCCVCESKFGVYICTECVLYDLEYKHQYHCDKCKLCRAGPKENFYHCDICDLCINKSIKHECIPLSERAACPVCHRSDIKYTREPCTIFSCAHFYHLACFNKVKGNHPGKGKCPKCLEE